MQILVTGGTGYIGSHTVVELIEAGYDVVVVDNLVNSCMTVLERVQELTGVRVKFYEADVCDERTCLRIFHENPEIDAVVHFAGLKAVGESVEKPLAYYLNNVAGAMALLKAMRAASVKKFVFSSSATVYGDPATVPVREDFPLSATSPYGATKLFIERILHDCCVADPDFDVAVLRYFNPIGAHRSGRIGEDPNGIPNNLLPYIAQVAVGRHEFVRVWGDDYPTPDGTGVRDYIHVVDLARGHVDALKKLDEHPGELICNLGTGRGYSVLEMIAAFERALGRRIPYKIFPRRPGDIATVYADPTRAWNELRWRAQYGIDDMCADTWRWQSANPDGYR